MNFGLEELENIRRIREKDSCLMLENTNIDNSLLVLISFVVIFDRTDFELVLEFFLYMFY